MKSVLLLLIFSVITVYTYSQDNIILKNGKKVDCKITNVDSVNVYITLNQNGNLINTFVDKSNVQSINYGESQNEVKEVKTDNEKNQSEVKKDNTEFSLKKNRIALTIGASFAVGDFGNKDVNYDKSGFAGTGASLNLFYFTHKFNPNWGFGIKWYGNSNLFDTKSFIDKLNTTSGHNWETNQSFWSSGGLLGGLVGFLPNGKTTFECNLLVGYMSLISPEATFTLSGTNAWFKMGSATATSFGYNIGAGMDYLYSERWSFLIKLDYLSGAFNFGDIFMVSSTGASQVAKGGSQTFGVVNLTFGLGYHIK